MFTPSINKIGTLNHTPASINTNVTTTINQSLSVNLKGDKYTVYDNESRIEEKDSNMRNINIRGGNAFKMNQEKADISGGEENLDEEEYSTNNLKTQAINKISQLNL